VVNRILIGFAPSEESAKDRLDHVIGINPPAQTLTHLALSQLAQTLCVPTMKFVGGCLITGPPESDQFVGRFGVVHHTPVGSPVPPDLGYSDYTSQQHVYNNTPQVFLRSVCR